MTYTAEMAHDSVARGMAFLDESYHGWELEINLRTLDLNDPAVCVLGQTAHCVTKGEVNAGNDSSYENTLRYLRDNYREVSDFSGDDVVDELDRLWMEHYQVWAVAHGFYLYHDDTRVAYEMLTLAWKEAIRERLNLS